MAEDSLVSMKNSNAIEPSSRQAWLEIIAKVLDLAAVIHGKELTQTEVEFWKQTLSKYKREHIERAFHEQLGESIYFPKPAEIRERIQQFILDEQPTLVEKVRRELAETSKIHGEEKKQ